MKLHILRHPIIQFLLFQMQWWTCILSASHNYPYIGAGIAIFICILEYWQLKFHIAELKIVLFNACIGILMDSTLSYFQFITYKYYVNGLGWLIPIWGIALWVSFATWLQFATYLKNYRLLISFATLFISPATYYVGGKFLVMEFYYGQFSLLVIGICWVIYMNLAIYNITHSRYE